MSSGVTFGTRLRRTEGFRGAGALDVFDSVRLAAIGGATPFTDERTVSSPFVPTVKVPPLEAADAGIDVEVVDLPVAPGAERRDLDAGARRADDRQQGDLQPAGRGKLRRGRPAV